MSLQQILMATGGGAAPVTPISLVVQTSKSAGIGVTTITTDPFDSTGSSLLVVVAANYGAASAAISDNKGNTYTPLTTYTATNPKVGIWYCENPTVGAGHIVANNGNFSTVIVTGWDNTANVAADGDNGATEAVASTVQPGSLTPSQNNSLVITAFCYFDQSAARSCSINGGFTLIELPDAASACAGLGYLVQTTATATNPTWTAPQNQYGLAAAITSFKHA